MKSSSVAASVGLGILVFLLLLAIVGVVFLRRYLKKLNGEKPSCKLGTYITPKEPPEFVIPPYTLISEGSDGTATPVSENGEIHVDEDTGKFSPPQVRRSLSVPSSPPGIRHGLIMTRFDEGGVAGGLSTKQYRPQYRRAVSQFTPHSAQTKREAARKTSVAPYGKLEVSIQFVTTKNLLFVQVCLYCLTVLYCSTYFSKNGLESHYNKLSQQSLNALLNWITIIILLIAFPVKSAIQPYERKDSLLCSSLERNSNVALYVGQL